MDLSQSPLRKKLVIKKQMHPVAGAAVAWSRHPAKISGSDQLSFLADRARVRRGPPRRGPGPPGTS
jgi:hypothetical protein